MCCTLSGIQLILITELTINGYVCMHVGGPCLSPIQYIPSTGTLVWDPPMCSGWQNDTVYIIRVETTDKHFERSTDRNSYILPADIKGLTAVTLQAYIQFLWREDGTKQNTDVGISTGQVASHSLYIISKGLLRFRKI